MLYSVTIVTETWLRNHTVLILFYMRYSLQVKRQLPIRYLYCRLFLSLRIAFVLSSSYKRSTGQNSLTTNPWLVLHHMYNSTRVHVGGMPCGEHQILLAVGLAVAKQPSLCNPCPSTNILYRCHSFSYSIRHWSDQSCRSINIPHHFKQCSFWPSYFYSSSVVRW